MTSTVDPSAIPEELRALKQWVVWKYETRDGKPTKVLYNAMTNARADSTDANTWTDFESAQAVAPNGYAGVGFVFVDGGGLVGIDLDNSLEGGKAKPWAAAIVRRFGTYTEVSPSGSGVKMWARGAVPGGDGRRRSFKDGKVEMYGRARFFTVTGQRFADSPISIVERQPQIRGLYDLVFSRPPGSPPKAAPLFTPTQDDQTIIDMLLGEKGGKGAKLWSGIWEGVYTSQSEADAGLCAKIGYYTGHDVDRIDRIFRQSALSDDKWAKRADYRQRTITGALATISKFYDWNSNGHSVIGHVKLSAPPQQLEKPPADSAEVLAELEDTISGKRVNVPWGWSILTRLARTLEPDTLTVLCGGSGSSKSLMLSQSCTHWLQNDIPFAVFHLEEDRKFHLRRALSQLEKNSKLQDSDWIRNNPDQVRSAYDRHMSTLDAMAGRIWDAPRNEITMSDLTDWVRDRCVEGCRVVAIDPITAADSGNEPWLTDKRFVLDSKTIIRDYGASLIVVTHPRDGNPKHGNHIDNMAGGRAWNRFTSNVMMLDSFDKEEDRTCQFYLAGHEVSELRRVNRGLKFRKLRNAKGRGAEIGFFFDGSSLLFKEQGVLVTNQ